MISRWNYFRGGQCMFGLVEFYMKSVHSSQVVGVIMALQSVSTLVVGRWSLVVVRQFSASESSGCG